MICVQLTIKSSMCLALTELLSIELNQDLQEAVNSMRMPIIEYKEIKVEDDSM